MLKVVSADKASEIIISSFSDFKLNTEEVDLFGALGRTLSEDIYSSESIPPYNRSTVDGYALRASDTYGSSESIPSQLKITGEILMGERAVLTVGEGECVKISTGGMVPLGADSVIMVENTDSDFEGLCLTQKAVSPFENVTAAGDDISEGALALSRGTLITSRHTGILAALGVARVRVFARPRVGIISTGDEIVPVDGKIGAAGIRDVNSHILSSLVRELGCESRQYGIFRDNYEIIGSAVEKACRENDIVLISGGSSAGSRDMTAEIISSLGELYFHGIALKPGKPTIFGKINSSAVFGLPGHPAAAYFVALRFLSPLIDMLSCRQKKERAVTGRLTQNISSNHGREEIVCVRLTDGGVEPHFRKSGVISLLSHSDGYIVIDRNCEGLKKGDEVRVNLF